MTLYFLLKNYRKTFPFRNLIFAAKTILKAKELSTFYPLFFLWAYQVYIYRHYTFK